MHRVARRKILSAIAGIGFSVAAASSADANTVYALGLTDLDNFTFGTSTATGTLVFGNHGGIVGGSITVVGSYTYDFTAPQWSLPSQYPKVCIIGNSCSDPGNATLELGPLIGAPPNSQIKIDLTYTDNGGILLFSGAGILTASPTPLPSTWTMMLIGLAGLGVVGYLQGRRPIAAAAT